jgi:hypothetical protein
MGSGFALQSMYILSFLTSGILAAAILSHWNTAIRLQNTSC